MATPKAPPRAVDVFEVGVRDGLQNESRPVSLEDKLLLAQGLVDAGLRDLELGAFVRSDRVPQMADSDLVFEAIHQGTLRMGKARAWALVPNLKGLERAIQAGAKRVAIFTAVTETFNKRNIGLSVGESLKVYAEVVREAKRRKVEVRAYLSTVFGCPYEGKVAPAKALRAIDRVGGLGVAQISIGDTIGVGNPRLVDAIVRPALRNWGKRRLAVHFHDTRGTALANTLRSLEHGVRIVDASAGGLGGCPFAPGATGNLATEDLVYMLDGMGVRTGVDLDRLADASLSFARRIGRPLSSRYLQAYEAQCARAGGQR